MRLREKKNLSRFAFPYIIAANLLKAFFSVLHQTTEIEGVQSRKCTDVAVEKRRDSSTEFFSVSTSV